MSWLDAVDAFVAAHAVATICALLPFVVLVAVAGGRE